MSSSRFASGNRVPRISVLLADDHEVLRTGLRMLLGEQGDMSVVGEAADGRTAVEMTKALRPDVVVLDLAMPLLNGFEATRQIHQAAPATRILVLSARDDDDCVARVMAVGAGGYVIKKNSFTTIATAIRAASNGVTFIDPLVARRLRVPSGAPCAHGGPPPVDLPRLSSREAEVLQLIAESKCNKECAVELGISVKTVEKHRQHVMEKLDIHDVAGLTRYAIAARIIESSDRILAS
jgi:DNA-binding NarL/FixJ family response regulator